MRFTRLLSSMTAALLPAAAHANTSVSGAANSVANGLMGAFGSGGFLGIVLYLRDQILALLYGVAVFLVVWAGVRLISSSDEGKLDAAKRTIAATAVGIMLAHLSLRILDAFYGPGGALAPGAGAQILSQEIGGIIDFVASIIGTVAILVILGSAIKAVLSFGKEDSEGVRNAVYGVVLGIGLIVISGAVKAVLGLPEDTSPGAPDSPTPDPIIARGVEIAVIILSFIALIAVGVIIYAGLLMVVNFGNEDQYEKAKGIIKRALTGLIVILFANLLIFFVVNIFVEAGGAGSGPPPIKPL